MYYYEKGLIKLAEEIAQSGIPEGTRKINGKYIQSHLLTKLKGIMKIQSFNFSVNEFYYLLSALVCEMTCAALDESFSSLLKNIC